MKAIITTGILISSIPMFGQISPMQELSEAFFSLSIEADIETVIEAAKQIERLDEIEYSFKPIQPYYQATFLTNNYFNIHPVSGRIEIFTIDDVVAGKDIDSLEIISLSLYFGNELTKEIRSEYKSLVNIFQRKSERIEKYELNADPGKIGYGQYFYQNDKDVLPFMGIEIGLGGCISDRTSIRICYYKNLSTT